MKTQDWFLCMIVLIVWSSSSALVAVFTKGLNPLLIAGTVVYISAILLTVITHYKKRVFVIREYEKSELKKLFIPAVLGLYLYPISYFLGISGSSPIKANVLNYLWPIIAVIASRLIFKKRFDRIERFSVWTAAFGAFIVLLLNEPMRLSSVTSSDFFYASIALLGAIFYGVYTATIEASIPKRCDTSNANDITYMPVLLRMNVMVIISSVLFTPLFLFYAISQPGLIKNTLIVLFTDRTRCIALLFYSCVNFSVAHLLWNKINTESNLSLTSSIAYMIPLFSTIILSYTAHISLGIIPVVGLVIVVTAIILNNRKYVNSINATLVGLVVVLILLKITPIFTNIQIIDNSKYFLEVIIAIYAIYDGFVMNRVINEHKKFEEMIDFLLIYKTNVKNKNREMVSELEKQLILLKKQKKEEEFFDLSRQIMNLFPKNISNSDKMIIQEYYHTLYRESNSALSPSEWVVISVLSLMIVILCFIIRKEDIVSTMFTTSISITVCLCASLLYEYELKRQALIDKLIKAI